MALSELQGVKNVDVDLARDRFTVSYDEAVVSTSDMFGAIKLLGFEPTVSESEFSSPQSTRRGDLPDEIVSLLSEEKPIAVYFGAKWCGACKIMERTTFTDDSVTAALASFTFLKIDIEESEAVSTAFAIRGVPTFVILDTSGDEAYRYVGPLNSPQIKLVLEQHSGE